MFIIGSPITVKLVLRVPLASGCAAVMLPVGELESLRDQDSGCRLERHSLDSQQQHQLSPSRHSIRSADSFSITYDSLGGHKDVPLQKRVTEEVTR